MNCNVPPTPTPVRSHQSQKRRVCGKIEWGKVPLDRQEQKTGVEETSKFSDDCNQLLVSVHVGGWVGAGVSVCVCMCVLVNR